jgi:hypothetical protein
MDGVYIVDTIDNTNIVKNISYESDDYGAVPENFNIFDHFQPDHFIKADFKNAYWHSNSVFVNPFKMNQSFWNKTKDWVMEGKNAICNWKDSISFFHFNDNNKYSFENSLDSNEYFEIDHKHNYYSINQDSNIIREPLQTNDEKVFSLE